MLVEADAADEAIAMTQAEPRGIVRLTCPVAMLESSVGDMLAAYLIRYPLVELQVYATNRRVDVVGEGIDIAIRVRPPPLEDSDLVLRTLSESNQCLVASPALLAQYAAASLLRSPANLTGLPGLTLGAAQSDHVWRLIRADAASTVEETIAYSMRLEQTADRRGGGPTRIHLYFSNLGINVPYVQTYTDTGSAVCTYGSPSGWSHSGSDERSTGVGSSDYVHVIEIDETYPETIAGQITVTNYSEQSSTEISQRSRVSTTTWSWDLTRVDPRD